MTNFAKRKDVEEDRRWHRALPSLQRDLIVIPAIMILVRAARGVLSFTSVETDYPSNSMITAAVCITLA